jgi:energy-coupling factor transport system ATP-binding protein
MNYIQINNFSYTYAGNTEKSLEDVNLQIDKGDFLLILGNSGSGKSTLAKCIAGTAPNFYGGTVWGDILIKDRNIRHIDHRDLSKEITMVFQDPERQLIMDKVHREIAFGLENVAVSENKIKRRVWEALQFLNIQELAYRDTASLSGGQKQKVAIASALAYLPECIILDEPTSQLDPSAAEEIINIIKKINEELGITVIVIEQRIGKWFDFADKIAVLNHGKVAVYGTSKEIYSSDDDYVNSFLPSYLKLSKQLKIKEMPENLKEARRKFISLNYSLNKYREQVSSKKAAKIEVRNLVCRYENTYAVKDLSFNVTDGDFMGLIGSNGAGKSTVLKTLAGLMKYSGSIKLPIGELNKLKLREVSKYIAYVSQNPNDYISKDTVYEEVEFTLKNHGINEKEIIEDILKDLDIYHLKDTNPRDISGGERQRVAIACMLVLRPQILLLDEPTRGLHYEAKIKLGRTLKKLNDSGTTIILVTHDMDFACEYCSRFLLMFDGEAAAEGTRSEVLSQSLYFTTTINKLFKGIDEDIFTISDIVHGEV